jgi:hypothetical protein
VKPWIQRRQLNGAYHSLLNDLRNLDQESFRNYMRMDLAAFEDLLTFVEHDLTKQDTKFRRSVGAKERLCIALRYLATGTMVIFFSQTFCPTCRAYNLRR